jgi:hypothetical protein
MLRLLDWLFLEFIHVTTTIKRVPLVLVPLAVVF